MGRLKPGATYIYERADGIVYAREFGSAPQDRFVIGYESQAAHDLAHDKKENELWADIRRTAKTNSALQQALDRVKVLYELSKQDE